VVTVAHRPGHTDMLRSKVERVEHALDEGA